jgi:hypothetical protein
MFTKMIVFSNTVSKKKFRTAFERRDRRATFDRALLGDTAGDGVSNLSGHSIRHSSHVGR